MAKPNYSSWDKKDLIKEVEALRKRKTYGLVWEEDKTKEVFDNYINWDGERTEESFGEEEGKFPVLQEVKTKSIDNQDPKYNLLIEGDNYHALAVLNFTHHKSIDVIYIDPPYNTGNKDFIYFDNFSKKSEEVKLDDPYRHSKYLSFMSKRLNLAKDLLKDTGVIFISIDDNEQAQLKLLCDYIFGENNYLGMIVVQVNKGGRDYLEIAKTHEYILCYGKSGKTKLNELDKNIDSWKLEDKKGKYEIRELRNRNPKFTRENRPNLYYPIYVNKNSCDKIGHCVISLKKTKDFSIEVYPKNSEGKDSCWRWGRELLQKNIIENDTEKSQVVAKQKKDNGWNIYEKSRKFTTKVKSIWDETEMRTERGTIVLRDIFHKAVFDHPKPVELTEKIIKLSTKKDSVVLDFFAGSGTTGHSVLKVNDDDGGNRKFILCTNNESNNGKGYRIATDICYPRLEKIIKGYKNLKGEMVKGFEGNLKYFKTGFVESAPTDKNKKKIVDKSTEMLCIKENAFKPIIDKKGYKVFKNTDIHLGIIFDDEQIDKFVKEAKNIKGKFHVYVFSFDDSVPKEDFKSMEGRIKLCPIPEVILHVYRKIFK
ncbi:MAG: site-specific DNA-methyltransferase [archaeon]